LSKLVALAAVAVLVPTASAAADSGAGPSGPARAADRSLSMNADGFAKVRLECPKGDFNVCRGTARLTVGRFRPIEGRTFDPRRPRRTWGTTSRSVRFSVEEGSTAAIRIELAPLSKLLVTRSNSVGGRLSIRPDGGEVVRTSIGVRAA
jgi:hypothetical protein